MQNLNSRPAETAKYSTLDKFYCTQLLYFRPTQPSELVLLSGQEKEQRLKDFPLWTFENTLLFSFAVLFNPRNGNVKEGFVPVIRAVNGQVVSLLKYMPEKVLMWGKRS